jgi:hypothetical protein
MDKDRIAGAAKKIKGSIRKPSERRLIVDRDRQSSDRWVPGMGTRLVVIPYDTLCFAGNKVTLPGGTEEGLQMLPELKYATG